MRSNEYETGIIGMARSYRQKERSCTVSFELVSIVRLFLIAKGNGKGNGMGKRPGNDRGLKSKDCWPVL